MRRPAGDDLRLRRESARLVRFLAMGSACARASAKEGVILVDGGERGVISAATETLASLLREGTLCRTGGRLALSAEGRARARREEAPAHPFRAQHGELGSRRYATEGGEMDLLTNFGESPLAQLARRRTRNGEPFLDEREFRAGERLRADYTRGQIMPRTGANWTAAVASGRRAGTQNGIADLTDAALAARQRVDGALAAVGPELAGVLVDICCFLKGFERVEMERGWPVRSAKVVLKAALAALSRHYEPHGDRQHRRSIVHWGAEDYRPKAS